MANERLDKIIVHEGYGSRKDVRKLLHSGLVAVNGKLVTDGAAKVDVECDFISIYGKKLIINKFVYLMMNKPQGYVCSKREGAHETVFSLLDDKYRTPFFEKSLHVVGRLDVDTEGLLIFTTDGALTHKITSPKERIAKKYFAHLARPLDKRQRDEYAEKCAKGFYVPPEGNEPGFDCMQARLVWLCDAIETTAASVGGETSDECVLTIYEGKFHEVKRMFSALGNEVVYLKRIAIGGVYLDEALAPGEYRALTDEELARLGKD